jgi:hypothetical protein
MLRKPINGLIIFMTAMFVVCLAGDVTYAQKIGAGSGKASGGGSSDVGKGDSMSAGAPSPYSRPSIGDFGRSRPPSMTAIPDEIRSRRAAAASDSRKTFTSAISPMKSPVKTPPNWGPDPFQPAAASPASIRRVPQVSTEPTKDPAPAGPVSTGLPIRRTAATPDSIRRVPQVSTEPTKVPDPAGPVSTGLPIRRTAATPDSIRRVPQVSTEPTKDPDPAGASRMTVVVTDPYRNL